MTYPGQFHRLVIYGSLYTDIFSTSLAFVPTPPGATTVLEPDDALLDAIHPIIGNWWNDTTTTTGAGIITQAQLKGIKINRIGPDGRYVDAVTHEYVYPSPIPGAVNSNFPPQLSPAVSLLTSVERGLANRGRMYLPPVGAFNTLGSDGRMSITQATEIATAVRRLLVELNIAYNDWPAMPGASPVAGVTSDVRSGQFRIISKVACGRVVDTIRTRRNSLVEAHVEAAALP